MSLFLTCSGRGSDMCLTEPLAFRIERSEPAFQFRIKGAGGLTMRILAAAVKGLPIALSCSTYHLMAIGTLGNELADLDRNLFQTRFFQSLLFAPRGRIANAVRRDSCLIFRIRDDAPHALMSPRAMHGIGYDVEIKMHRLTVAVACPDLPGVYLRLHAALGLVTFFEFQDYIGKSVPD